MGQTTETQTLYCNVYGQIECHGCGCYSDIIYPVHLQGTNSSWVSMLCSRCRDTDRVPRITQIDDPINKKTYKGPIENMK